MSSASWAAPAFFLSFPPLVVPRQAKGQQEDDIKVDLSSSSHIVTGMPSVGSSVIFLSFPLGFSMVWETFWLPSC